MEQYYSLTLEGMGNYMSVNILLADDHMMVREGLKQLLEMDDDINAVSYTHLTLPTIYSV